MPTRIKNCGLKTPEAIDQAIATGAGFIGFVHHPSSPRGVSLDDMAALAKHTRHRAKIVAVMVNPTEALVASIALRVQPDYLQLHEMHDASAVQAIYEQHRIPIISAVSVRDASDLTLASMLEEISAHVLFDAKTPGSGKPFDWRLLKNLPLKKKWFLAGGLTPENVAEAIRITHAPMVDVSSGIEDPPGSGNKSLEKIAAFNAAVLHAS